ncbi:MAG TPA: MFS transporter [Acidimicrobiales bacterium]|nr:MFS transporter [Acidimicrobiales bacterium]
MTAQQGWRPFTPPQKPQSRVTSAFARLAHAHLVSTSGDAALATALAGSLFFTLPTGEARGKVLLYLLFTMAPFSVVAPLIGPLVDRVRGGRRIMVIVSGIGRAVLCFVMIQHVKSLLFFPEAFGVLVLQKTYTITKPALVPSTVESDDELVEANSKLSLLSGIGSVVGAGPGALAYKIAGGAQGALVVAMLFYLATAALGLRLPKVQVASEASSHEERAELHSTSILLGGSAMGMIRGIVGFMTLFIAFAFYKKSGTPWELAVVGGSSVVGSQIGALIAPPLRRMTKEENLLMGALGAITIAGVLASLSSGVMGAMILAAIVGIAAACGKLAFDSIVQRDAPDANRGRSFARFETRFQILWVVGALIAIAPMPKEAGYLVVLFVAAVTLFSYAVGSKASEARARAVPLTGVDAAAVQLDQRMNRLAGEARERVRAAATGWRHRDQRPLPAETPLPPPTGWPVWIGDDPPPRGIDDQVGPPRPRQAALDPARADRPTSSGSPSAAPAPGPEPPTIDLGPTSTTVPFEPSPLTFPDEPSAADEPATQVAPDDDEAWPS